MNNITNARTLARCAAFTALIAVGSMISIPLPGLVPINLAHVGIFMASLLLAPIEAVFSVLVFILLGAFGLPIFSGGRGGFSVLAGPTGGFIVGYLCTALVSSTLVRKFSLSRVNAYPILIIGDIATYIPGIAWFMISTGSGIVATLTACVLPFLIGDAFKIVFSAEISLQLRKIRVIWN